MFSILLALFIIVPLIEAYLLVTVGGMIGAGPTIAILLLTGVVGAALARREGLRAIAKVQNTLAQGMLPGKELMSGALVLGGGLLLLTPGFMTDVIGFLCLFPLTREPLRLILWQGIKRYGQVTHIQGGAQGPFNQGPFNQGHTQGGVIIDVEGHSTEEERQRGWDIGRTHIEIGPPRSPQDEGDSDA